MPACGPRPGRVAIQVSLAAIFVSLELSRSTWLITSLVPGGGDKMSKHSVRSGDIAELMTHLAKLREKAHGRAGASFPIIAIQEAGLDGFWVHRGLERAGIESHVVDAPSILPSRRRRAGRREDKRRAIDCGGASANALGVQAWRTPRLHHGQGTEPGGGGGPAPA